jgi:signal transduction histidine kinase
MLSLARDVADRKQAEEALRKERRLLRDLLNLHEHDRQLMAYEIHDGLAQLLTGALYQFQSIAHLQHDDPTAAAAAFDEATQLLAKGIAEARRLISGLRPPILDELGVVAAVEFLISEQGQRGGPQIEFAHEVQFERLAAPLESSIFRIIQESLTNACRYSQSDRIRVQLLQVDDRIQICVQDWGVGFDPANVGGDHFGLRGIRERARLLGGNATIETAPSEGTRICVELPIMPQPMNGIANGDKLP